MQNVLILAVVQSSDGRKAVDELVRLGFTATTIRLGSTFLDAGDSILLVGCDADRRVAVEEAIGKVCRARVVSYVPSFSDPLMEIPVVQEVEEGGGVLIALLVEQCYRLPGKGSRVVMSA